ncbi:MAG: bifunctional (p)ppGpp synthetase/guanosine-3',5'-bis(diphosphate) 3'-pyrophosphohydrolase [Clostridiales Family XIII bacterium]|jgi:GTP pyrophosphokinase|nr:bifunctional (p)ppGpp synthetase/guanosine-3',5'-bis(diphosphate) 3'-pyrophosphohydrolase [Clostridiales Family XIII bacterium]
MDSYEVFLGELLDINLNYDIGLIEKAYRKAEQMHEGQTRKSGEPYLTHPAAVAKILAELGMDERTLAAGLLHDAVEDTPYSLEDVQKDFGSDVALLVDGVTKLGSLVFNSKEEQQAENIRKMFLAMSKDIRVIIIKLADRLHNLRTINYMNHDQIVNKCTETLEVYAPLASRLGMYNIKFEMEDIAFKFLNPDDYYKISDAVKSKRDERQAAIDEVIRIISKSLDEIGLKYEIYGRSKHFYSIFRKMRYQNKGLDEIFDLMAVRIIVDTVKDCYTVLGTVHSLWKSIPSRFKDYVNMPKPNLYQSIHTTVIGNSGRPFEIQIRTWAMHHVAEYGIAAHWKYKEGVEEGQEEVKLAWLRQTLEWNQEMDDPREFIEALKMDLFSNQVFVFTPRGDVMELPAGSTPLDFAYKIHSDIGSKCSGAKVNGRMVSIDYVLQNGEIVDILTSNNAKPSMDWLNIAKSSNARSKIRQYLKKQDKSQNVDKGKEMLEKAVKRKGFAPHDIIRNTWMLKIARSLHYQTIDDLYSSIASGGVVVGKVLAPLETFYHEDTPMSAEQADQEAIAKASKPPVREVDPGGVLIDGMAGMQYRMAKCCHPVPGDSIVAFLTKGGGASIHRTDCTNIVNIREEDRVRLIKADWNMDERQIYNADIYIQSDDRKGLFSDISRRCVEMDVNIAGVNLKTNEDGTVTILMTLSISNTSEMDRVLRSLKQIESVRDVYRAS